MNQVSFNCKTLHIDKVASKLQELKGKILSSTDLTVHAAVAAFHVTLLWGTCLGLARILP